MFWIPLTNSLINMILTLFFSCFAWATLAKNIESDGRDLQNSPENLNKTLLHSPEEKSNETFKRSASNDSILIINQFDLDNKVFILNFNGK